jgi:hypothetical protein
MLNSEFDKIVRQRVRHTCAIMAYILIPTFFLIGWSARIITQNDKEQKARINAYNAIYKRVMDNIIRDELQTEDKIKSKQKSRGPK